MTAALLLAEPEPAIRGYLERQLASDGFHVLQATFGGEALALAERTRPDLVLCSELELCARLREGEPGRTWNRDVPVIVLGPSRGRRGRPRARVPARRRRLPAPGRSSTTSSSRGSGPCCGAPRRPRRTRLDVGELDVDRPARVVTVRGEAVHLAGKEFELLAALAAEPHRVFTKDELLRDVWGYRSLHADADARLARLAPAPEARARAAATTSSSTSGGWATSSSTDYASGTRMKYSTKSKQLALVVQTDEEDVVVDARAFARVRIGRDAARDTAGRRRPRAARTRAPTSRARRAPRATRGRSRHGRARRRRPSSYGCQR